MACHGTLVPDALALASLSKGSSYHQPAYRTLSDLTICLSPALFALALCYWRTNIPHLDRRRVFIGNDILHHCHSCTADRSSISHRLAHRRCRDCNRSQDYTHTPIALSVEGASVSRVLDSIAVSGLVLILAALPISLSASQPLLSPSHFRLRYIRRSFFALSTLPSFRRIVSGYWRSSSFSPFGCPCGELLCCDRHSLTSSASTQHYTSIPARGFMHLLHGSSIPSHLTTA